MDQPRPTAQDHEAPRRAPVASAAPKAHPAVLLIDDDLGMRELLCLAFRSSGLRVETAATAAEGLTIARQTAFDILLVDLVLPDMPGTDLVRALRQEVADLRFILLSGFLTTAVTVEAMRLGAIDVIEKPVSVDELLELVSSIVGADATSANQDDVGPVDGLVHAADFPLTTEPGCAAERWAMHVVKGCRSAGDIRTLQQWAVCAGVSYTSLRESCRLVGIRPHDARDFTRVLRAVSKSHGLHCDPEVLLDVSDSRTLAILLGRAGLPPRPRAGPVAVEQFLSGQRFVPHEHAGLAFLRQRLATIDLA